MFFFGWRVQEGLFLLPAALVRGRVDRPDAPAPPSPRYAASGSLSPSVFARWDGVKPEIPAHLERRGGRGGKEKADPRSPYCGPEVLGNGSREKSSKSGGDRPGGVGGGERA